MKKYLPGLFAIAFAICLSAFSNRPASNQPSNAGKKAPLLFWYVINPDGSVGSPLNSGAQMDKTTALAFTPCQDVITTECDRGYSTRQTVGTKPAPATSSNPDYHINKTQ